MTTEKTKSQLPDKAYAVAITSGGSLVQKKLIVVKKLTSKLNDGCLYNKEGDLRITKMGLSRDKFGTYNDPAYFASESKEEAQAFLDGALTMCFYFRDSAMKIYENCGGVDGPQNPLEKYL